MLRLLPFLMILSLPSFAQSEDVLQQIRDRYQAVNKNIVSYKVSEISMPGISTEGAGLQGYFSGDSLQLLVQDIYGEMEKRRLEMYYDKGALVFYYERYYRYEVPMYDSSFSQHKMFVDEYRAYFYKGKMIRFIDEKNKIFTKRDAEFIKTEQKYLESVAPLYNIMSGHRYDGRRKLNNENNTITRRYYQSRGRCYRQCG